MHTSTIKPRGTVLEHFVAISFLSLVPFSTLPSRAAHISSFHSILSVLGYLGHPCSYSDRRCSVRGTFNIISSNYLRQRLHICGHFFSMRSLFVRHMLLVYVVPHLGLKFLHSPAAKKQQYRTKEYNS